MVRPATRHVHRYTHEVIWAAAGHHRTVFPTRFEEVAAATSAETVAVG